MGCRTEPAAVHIGIYCKGWISFNFSIIFIIYTTYSKKKLHDLPQKLENSIFFYNSHDLQQKKIYTPLQQKKKHDYTVFLYTTFHHVNGTHTPSTRKISFDEDREGTN